MKNLFLGIDIGGTWIKGAAISIDDYWRLKSNNPSVRLDQIIAKVEKTASPFSEKTSIEDFIKAISLLAEKVNPENIPFSGIGISSSGIINYHGTRIEKSMENLNLLKKGDWKGLLESHYTCPVTIINDNDAASIGMAELSYLQGFSTIGVMTIGTGLGFSVWRNGRRWRPGGRFPLLGSIYTPEGSFNDIASASKLSGLHKDRDLAEVLSNPAYAAEREKYFKNLAGLITTATIIYSLDEVCLSGGLIDATLSVNLDIKGEILPYLAKTPPELDHPCKISIIKEGNLLQLLGALSLIIGEYVAQKYKQLPEYNEITTESPYNQHLLLHQFKAEKIVHVLFDAENEAGEDLKNSITKIARTAERIASTLGNGGRLIYVGSGTSGRIAAMDALEIPCTYGLPKDKIITLIAGGVADAAIDIESNFEEDASSIPEMLLLNISDRDMVIGISASGSAYFVQSALSYAKFRGAYTVMIQNSIPIHPPTFCHTIIPFYSGSEVVAGSTRMKAGTATKKILNFMTTTAMILNGEVIGPYMTGLACINNKLISRAQSILKELYNLPEEESLKLLKENQYELKKVLGKLG